VENLLEMPILGLLYCDQGECTQKNAIFFFYLHCGNLVEMPILGLLYCDQGKCTRNNAIFIIAKFTRRAKFGLTVF
jgi:hypothetical protein